MGDREHKELNASHPPVPLTHASKQQRIGPVRLSEADAMLLKACLSHKPERVAAALKSGANPNCRVRGFVPLVTYLIPKIGCEEEIYDMLFRAGADPNALSYVGRTRTRWETALLTAIDFPGGNAPKLVSMFISAGANVDKPSAGGTLPLDLAMARLAQSIKTHWAERHIPRDPVARSMFAAIIIGNLGAMLDVIAILKERGAPSKRRVEFCAELIEAAQETYDQAVEMYNAGRREVLDGPESDSY